MYPHQIERLDGVLEAFGVDAGTWLFGGGRFTGAPTGRDGPLRCLPQNRVAPAKPALERRELHHETARAHAGLRATEVLESH